jgi:hypothetical protein
VLRKLGESDGIVLKPLVTDLNLSLELAITTPLKIATESVKKYYSTENVTDADTYMRCHLGTKWRGKSRIQEGIASANNRGIERKAKSPVRVQEKYGHLQFRFLYVANSVGHIEWDPQALRNHSSITHDPTVEHPSVWVGKSNSNIFRNRSGDESAAFRPRKKRGKDRVALQNIKEVLLSLLRTETLRYIPVDQDL